MAWWVPALNAEPIRCAAFTSPDRTIYHRWQQAIVAPSSLETPPGWNGWLHHTVDVPPSEEDYKPHPWELPHIGNPTGTPQALRPKGSTMGPGVRQATGGDYQAWTPGG